MRKYLDFYYECMKTGQMPCDGLCQAFSQTDEFKLIDPDRGEQITYWGCDEPERGHEHRSNTAHVFGPLRQTVVLLMAAMNGEL